MKSAWYHPPGGRRSMLIGTGPTCRGPTEPGCPRLSEITVPFLRNAHTTAKFAKRGLTGRLLQIALRAKSSGDPTRNCRRSAPGGRTAGGIATHCDFQYRLSDAAQRVSRPKKWALAPTRRWLDSLDVYPYMHWVAGRPLFPKQRRTALLLALQGDQYALEGPARRTIAVSRRHRTRRPVGGRNGSAFYSDNHSMNGNNASPEAACGGIF
jgi:hypothetical protein